ncbi:MAG: Na(+)-translocating NADH-quinone reductase subunit C [Microscillaceae bacterium]
MAKKSNSYVLIYTIVLTIVCGSLLAIASEGLKPYKEANVAFDTKRNILGTIVDISGYSTRDLEALYKEAVVATYLVNSNGEKVDKPFDQVKIDDEYRKPVDERILPVYELADPKKPGKTAYYVFPMWGFGLWDSIWGWVALESDFTTIKGVVFAQKGETPGLGARISEKDIQSRFTGKKIFDKEQLAVVQMQKGEGNDYSADAHKVDGMSGATITGQGLNKMLSEYFEAYLPFIKGKKGGKVSLR